MSLREYELCIAAVQRRKKAEVQDRRVLQQELAQLISFAFHKPEDMPDLARGSAQKSKQISPELGLAQLRAGMIRLNSNNKGPS